MIEEIYVVNEGTRSFQAPLEEYPFDLSVTSGATDRDFSRNTISFRLRLINTQNHSDARFATVAVTFETILNVLGRGYDKTTFLLERLVARRFLQWARLHPGEAPSEDLVINSEDLNTLKGARLAREIAEANLARCLIDGYNSTPSNTYTAFDIFVSTVLTDEDGVAPVLWTRVVSSRSAHLELDWTQIAQTRV